MMHLVKFIVGVHVYLVLFSFLSLNFASAEILSRVENYHLHTPVPFSFVKFGER